MKVRWAALACDYDGTLADHGHVYPATLAALRRVRRARRKLLLVTGRELAELCAVFPAVSVFDRVVAENGALIFEPATGVRQALADRPDPSFISALKKRRVEPLGIGRSIVAT